MNWVCVRLKSKLGFRDWGLGRTADSAADQLCFIACKFKTSLRVPESCQLVIADPVASHDAVRRMSTSRHQEVSDLMRDGMAENGRGRDAESPRKVLDTSIKNVRHVSTSDGESHALGASRNFDWDTILTVRRRGPEGLAAQCSVLIQLV